MKKAILSIQKKFIALLLLLSVTLLCTCIKAESLDCTKAQKSSSTISVSKIDGISDGFITGVDISSLLSLEASGRVFYGFDGKEQDLFKTLSESGVNYIRVRVWNDPFDENGNGYGGGNCTVDTAITLGKRAAEYGMGLLVDFHYSDFWADPGKQQAPKVWKNMTLEEKSTAIYNFTSDSILKIQQNGIRIGMVQIGNETTNGLCGETDKANMYTLMRSAAQSVRDTNPQILIATHFTNPEKKGYSGYAKDLQTYKVDYDVFATSYYPEYHGTLANLTEQLKSVHNVSGKKVMIAETSWAYTSSVIGAYKRSIQGQADEISSCIRAMTDLGDYAIGVFYWEPAWIDVPGETEEERNEKRENFGAGWASSYAGSYDPDDAGKYYGGTGCIPMSLFNPDGYPFESLKTFLYVRQGSEYKPFNYIVNPSFEDKDTSMWEITENSLGTVGFQNNKSNARDGDISLHFWSENEVEFTAEQKVMSIPEGKYYFSLSAQGDGAGENAALKIYAISDGVRYEQDFRLGGFMNWKVPMIEHIPCKSGTMTVGIKIKASAGAWGNVDCVELIKEFDASGNIVPKAIFGDADGDGNVTVIDATIIQKHLAQFDMPDTFNISVSDVNADGTVSICDVTEIQRYLAGFDNIYHIGEIVSEQPRYE